MSQRVLGGVSVASVPVGAGGASFGDVRSKAIYEALGLSVALGETREQFIQRALEALWKRGVNPEAPHLNLPPPGGGP